MHRKPSRRNVAWRYPRTARSSRSDSRSLPRRSDGAAGSCASRHRRRTWSRRTINGRQRVEVVERKNRVLLLAGGPLREYRFLRNLLFRDPNTTLHAVLQSAPPGAAQEADEVLPEFPQDAETLFEYDCLVAFDPDWRQLTDEQTELLDRWVAEKAGGLILIAGPVFTPYWSRASRGVDEMKLNRRSVVLYPVTFFRRGSADIQLGRVNSETAWPLEFTREGRQAPFLWLEDEPPASQSAWSRFSRGLRISGSQGHQAGCESLRTVLGSPGDDGRVKPRSTWRASSTERGACSIWAAAKCGGCAAWMKFLLRHVLHKTDPRSLAGSPVAGLKPRIAVART